MDIKFVAGLDEDNYYFVKPGFELQVDELATGVYAVLSRTLEEDEADINIGSGARFYHHIDTVIAEFDDLEAALAALAAA